MQQAGLIPRRDSVPCGVGRPVRQGHRDMQERALSAAILKTIKDINSLVEFCSAEESGRKSAPTVGAIRSSYQEGKHTQVHGQGQGTPNTTHSRCDYCGGTPHSNTTRAVREKECKAFNIVCKSCVEGRGDWIREVLCFLQHCCGTHLQQVRATRSAQL